jgi:hypothetical protein
MLNLVVKVKVTLRLTVIQSVILGVETHLGLKHWYRGFESYLRHGCLYAFILCLFCTVFAGSDLAMG